MMEELGQDARTPDGQPGEYSESRTYRFHILLDQDKTGTVSAIVMNLPGTGSCGDTEEEALANVEEAIRGVLEEYKSSGESIPWQDTTAAQVPPGARAKWISMDA